MELIEFIAKFEEIKAMGWVKSKRKGPTGIGHTLEELLDIPENNIATPDLGKIELKAHRINSTSMITLFTFNRKVWKMQPLEAIKKYGTLDDNGRLGMYFTMSQKPNRTGLFLHIEDDAISVRHISGEIIAEWQLDSLAERFMQKFPAMIFVSALSETDGKAEWFKFNRAQFLTGTSKEVVRNQILSGNILIDLRLHDKGTRARNHGTGFSAHVNKLPMLFTDVKDL